MAVTASDIMVYGSTVMPTGDDVNPGGPINTAVKMTFTDMSQTTGLVMGSNGISDALQVTVTGRNAGGSIVTDKFTIFNTLKADNTGISNTQFERILRAVVTSGSHTGTITIAEDNFPTFTTLATMEVGVDNIFRPFYGVSSSASNAKDYFEKIFIKNNNGVNALLSASVVESGEVGFSDKIFFDLSSTGNDDGYSSNNRLGPPPASQLLNSNTGIPNDTAKNVVGGDLMAGSGQGIWMRLSLGAGAVADKGSVVFQIDGSTTA